MSTDKHLATAKDLYSEAAKKLGTTRKSVKSALFLYRYGAGDARVTQELLKGRKERCSRG